MKVAMDVEGVLADIVGTWIYVYNYPFKKEDITEYNFSNLTKEYGIHLGRFLKETTFLWKMEIVRPEQKGIGKIIRDLGIDYHYDIVSGRDMPFEIEVFLRKNEIPYGEIITGGAGMDKPMLGYDVYIDDHPKLYKKLKPNQIQIMRSQPWNRLVHHKQVIRAVSMEHIFFELRKLEGIMNDRLGINTR